MNVKMIRKMLQLIVVIGSLAALWSAGSAPFFQGPGLHW